MASSPTAMVPVAYRRADSPIVLGREFVTQPAATLYTDSIFPLPEPGYRTTSRSPILCMHNALPGTVEEEAKQNKVAETCRRHMETTTDKDAVFASRCTAIRDLNAMLALPETSISDAAIEAVVKLVMGDLCYGEVQDLAAHVHGAREMVRVRGGLAALGENETLGKMVLV